MNHETASALGGTLGVVEKVVESEEERGREGCMRVRVKVDISKPLCRGKESSVIGRERDMDLHSNTNAFQISATGVDYSHTVIEIVRNGYEAKALYAGRINNMELGFELLWKDQYDENLPNPFGDDSATAVNAEQILPTNPAASILSTDPSTAVNVEQILSTNSAASMQYSDPNTAVNVEKTLPKKSTASIPSFDPSIAANHVEKDVHSCAKSPPNDSATAVNMEQILSTNSAASMQYSDQNTAVNVEKILPKKSTNSAASMQYFDQNTAVNVEKTLSKKSTNSAASMQYSDQNTAVNVEKTLPKTSTASIPSFDPSIAANRVEKDVHSCAKSPPDFLQQNAVHSCVKSSPHFPQKNDVGKKGVKRSGALSDGDSNYSGWQKKVRGNEGNQSTTLDGDEAEAVAVLVLHNLVKSEGPTVLFLMETKLDVRGMESIRVKLGFKFCFSVPCLGRSGGLALLWNDPAQVTIQNFSQNHVDSHVQLAEGAKWRFTGFYGHPEGHRKWESWVLLDKLHSLDNTPWLCMGDFNEILSISERSGEVLGSTRRMQDFSDVVNRCGLIDLGFRGIPFTWENRRDGEALIQKRLDRALANAAWLDCFNLCSVSHVVCSYSDHVPLLLHMDTSTRHCQPKRRPRKFEEKWSLHPECEAIIQDVWSREEAIGSPMFILCEKIKHCREALYRWYKDVSGEFQNKIKVHTASLTSLISSNFAGQNNSAIASLKAEINKLLLSEELHWRQRSRMTWLAAGDSNTKFFHSQANQRRRTNCLSGLWNSDNVWCTDESQIEDIAVSYFDDIFPHINPCEFGGYSSLLSSFSPQFWEDITQNEEGKKGEMALKLDMSKAYDRVEWAFIEGIMRKLGFAERWISLLMECICTVQYSVLIDGVPKGYINPTRGIRQGDPLSPYVFLLCAEGLSALFQQASAMGHLKGIQSCRGGPWGASIFDKYLGLPAMIGRSKKSIFNGLKERIVQRLQGWKEKFLSKAGREVLIKAVAQAIPTYAMNCFRLPKAWCEEVNGLIARYWWGQKKDERKLHWIKWDKLCTAKAEGGLGFRNLHSFNTALLAKQCWRLIHNTQSLFYRVFKARYFPSCSFTEAQMGSNPSFLWRSILSGRGVLNKGLRWHHEEGQLSRPLWSETKTGLSLDGYGGKLWKLAIPGKIKHFLWRAYHETLPTNHQLHRRKIRSSSLCSICDQKEETTYHAIWQCPLARNTWALIHGRLQKLSNQDGEFSRFLQWIFKALPKEEVEDWAVTAWSIWNARNRFVHEDCQVPPQTIRANALAIRSEFNQARLSFQH
uniref:Reverse transcriptase domain-containing protein n=1 Tax=Fagus sylvatica TaxID=28930 RepID=A0A2N9IH27_FAGSY